MAEMNKMESENQVQSTRSEASLLRCAKAAFLLSTLRRHCANSTESTAAADDEDGGEAWELKKALVKERSKNKKMRICSLAELFLQITILLSLLTLCLLFAFNFL